MSKTLSISKALPFFQIIFKGICCLCFVYFTITSTNSLCNAIPPYNTQNYTNPNCNNRNSVHPSSSPLKIRHRMNKVIPRGHQVGGPILQKYCPLYGFMPETFTYLVNAVIQQLRLLVQFIKK